MQTLFRTTSGLVSLLCIGIILLFFAIGIVTVLKPAAEELTTLFSPLPYPTRTPFDIEAMQVRVEREDIIRKRLTAEGKNHSIQVAGVETLGTDLRPHHDLVMPDMVYINSMGSIDECWPVDGKNPCPQYVRPLYSFRSIKTDVIYSIDSALTEFFRNGEKDEFSEKEKEEVRQHFPSILAQMQIVKGPKSVTSGKYLSVDDMEPALRADQKFMLELREPNVGFRAIFVAPERLDAVLATIDENELINIIPPDTETEKEHAEATAASRSAEATRNAEARIIALRTQEAERLLEPPTHTPTPPGTSTPLPSGYPPPKATMIPQSHMAESDYSTILDFAPEVPREE